MSARFRVVQSFPLASMQWFVLAGEVTEGTVRPGMRVHIPFNDAVAMWAPIRGVEDIRSSDPGARVALTIEYEDDLDLAMWQGLNIGGGEVLEVTEAPEEPEPATPAPLREARRPWWKLW